MNARQRRKAKRAGVWVARAKLDLHRQRGGRMHSRRWVQLSCELSKLQRRGWTNAGCYVAARAGGARWAAWYRKHRERYEADRWPHARL